MPDHAGLRKRERQKNADRVERNEAARIAAKASDQQAREQREDDDAVGEDKLVSAVAKLFRNKPVAGKQAGKAREVRKSCVRRKDQYRRRGSLNHVVEPR